MQATTTTHSKSQRQRRIAREFSDRLDARAHRVLKIAQKAVRMKFCGMQNLGQVWMPLWTLLENIEACENGGVGFIKDSTLSQITLDRCGYFVPNPTGWKVGQIYDPNLAA